MSVSPCELTRKADGRAAERATLICFSHLRWDFVYQRPQHLMTRFARDMNVLYVEEPVWTDGDSSLVLRKTPSGVEIAVPHIPAGLSPEVVDQVERVLLDRLLSQRAIRKPILWYYTPMSFAFSEHIDAGAVIYDCMDELSAFRGAPPELVELERKLFARAGLVFTGGYSLYEAKRAHHPHVHAFPSSVDVAHFARARTWIGEPTDQQDIARPRIGHYAVLDERLDINLVAAIAAERPDWQLILVGPVVKIDQNDLPRRDNIHYLGPKTYQELPAYLSGWDVAFMPFARNESTRFISPTKTPEYLAAGLPVVSTAITDVIGVYGRSSLVEIAHSTTGFIAAIARLLDNPPSRAARLAKTDAMLAEMSWDKTWAQMRTLIDA
jgi:UDP-galactopyranose mutase